VPREVSVAEGHETERGAVSTTTGETMNHAINRATAALATLQQETIDVVLEILECGDATGHDVPWRDDNQRARVRVLRDRLTPNGRWAKPCPPSVDSATPEADRAG
jgi:hypothetical protein